MGPGQPQRILPPVAIFVSALLVGLDQLTKYLVVTNMSLGATIPLGLGFNLTHSRNSGAAFGLLRDVNFTVGGLTVNGVVLLGILSAVVSIFLLVYLLRSGRTLGALTRTALALVLAGAVGNMIDRFRLGYVVDFIHFRVGWFDFPIFNVADSCVVIGAGLLIIASLFGPGGDSATAGGNFKRGPAPRNHQLDEVPEAPPLVKEEDTPKA